MANIILLLGLNTVIYIVPRSSVEMCSHLNIYLLLFSLMNSHNY